MRHFLIAASMLALAACGGTTTENSANTAVANDLAAVDNMLVDDGTTMAGNMAAGAATVTITISGVSPNAGPVLVALQNEADFGKQAGTYTATVEPTAATVTATISGVAPGSYAAAVVQDTNKDGSFTLGDTGPTEPFGFSGTAQTGAPTFAPASFNVTETGGTATVTLKGN